MKRLHPPSPRLWRDKQARLLVFCEDVKKRLHLLSEVVLRTVKRRLASSFAIFFGIQKCFYGIAFISFRLSRIFAKKMAEEVGFEPTVQLPVHNISNVAPSTTRPLLRGNKYFIIYYII